MAAAACAVLVLTLASVPQAHADVPQSCGGIMGVLTCNPIVKGVVGVASGAASGNPLPVIGGALALGKAGAAAWMRGFVGTVMDSSILAIGAAISGVVHELAGPTIPKSFPGWFMDTWGVTQSLGFQILFLVYVIAVIAGVVKANLARVAQAPVLALAIVLGMFTVLVAVSVAVQVVDWASLQILRAPVGAALSGLTTLRIASIVAGPGSNLMMGFLVTFLLLVAFVVLWFNLLVRKWIIYIAAGLLGLALSGSLTKAGAKWCKFLAVLVGAVVVSKLLLVAILAYGVAALTSPQSMSDMIAGGSVVLVSGISPWLLVGIIWGGSTAALHGGMQAATHPGRKARQAARSAQRTTNHWQSWHRQRTAKQARATATAQRQASTVARQRAAAAKAASASLAAAATAAKRATATAKRVPARVVAAAKGKPAPAGTTHTPSGLVVPKPGHHMPHAGPRPGPSTPSPKRSNP